MFTKRIDTQDLFNILILVPCFVAVPIVALDIYNSWYLGITLVWTVEFTSLVVCAVLGGIAGLGIFLKLKWARVISLVFFIAGMLIWFVVFAIEFSHKSSGHASTLSLLFLIYGICICILLFFNGDFMDDDILIEQEYHDILDK